MTKPKLIEKNVSGQDGRAGGRPVQPTQFEIAGLNKRRSMRPCVAVVHMYLWLLLHIPMGNHPVVPNLVTHLPPLSKTNLKQSLFEASFLDLRVALVV